MSLLMKTMLYKKYLIIRVDKLEQENRCQEVIKIYMEANNIQIIKCERSTITSIYLENNKRKDDRKLIILDISFFNVGAMVYFIDPDQLFKRKKKQNLLRRIISFFRRLFFFFVP